MIGAHDDISTLEAITARMLQLHGGELDTLANLARERSTVVKRVAARRDLAAADAARLRKVVEQSAAVAANLRTWRQRWLRDAAECQRKQQFADEVRGMVPGRESHLNIRG